MTDTELGLADGRDSEDDDDVLVLPWWRNPVTIVAAVVGLVLLAGASGYVLGNNAAVGDHNATDVGFLQDMRFHHEQATALSYAFLNDDDVDGRLRTVAATILLEQQIEIGRMIQLLRDFGEPEANETDIAMAWMGDPVPLDEMPGLATADELDALRGATGAAADDLFVRLMTEHHRGGIEMAQHARDHAASGEVRHMADQIVAGQQEEITELETLLARSRG